MTNVSLSEFKMGLHMWHKRTHNVCIKYIFSYIKFFLWVALREVSVKDKWPLNPMQSQTKLNFIHQPGHCVSLKVSKSQLVLFAQTQSEKQGSFKISPQITFLSKNKYY